MFDTYKTSGNLDNLIDCGLEPGWIVIAACQDECSASLSEKAKQWFAWMGSHEIWDLKHRQGFVFIGVAG